MVGSGHVDDVGGCTILQKEHATFTNYGLIRMGDARVDAIDDFAEITRHLQKL